MAPRYGGSITRSLRRQVFATYPPICHLCGADGATTVDHLIPRSKGGMHTLDNSRPAHLSCNSMRQDMELTEWFKRHPLRSSQPSRRW